MKDYSTRYFNDIAKNEQKEKKLVKFNPIELSSTLLVLFVLSGIVYLAMNIPKLIFAPPETIFVQGNNTISKQNLLRQLAITQDQNWIDLDPYYLSLRLNQHPWIQKSIVRRIIPLGLEISIVERSPVAYLKSGNELFLMDKEGWILERPQTRLSWNLPIATLEKSQRIDPGVKIRSAVLSNIIELMAILEGDSILPLSSISEINATNPLNIELITIPDGTRIKFGYKNFKSGLQKLKLVSPTIKNQIGKIKYIDLRQLNGVAIKKAKN